MATVNVSDRTNVLLLLRLVLIKLGVRVNLLHQKCNNNVTRLP